MKKQGIATGETLFLCLARDCASTLPRFFAYLDAMRSAGMPCRAVIGENGSVDDTRDRIVAASGSKIELLDTSAMASGSGRLQRMAIGRELLLDAARRIHAVESFSFLCVADLDNVMEQPPSVAAMKQAMHTLAADETLFAVGATSSPVYYDLLALRAPGYDFHSLDADIAAAKRSPLTYHRFHKRRIYQPQRDFTTSEAIRCQSSFNGLCLYRAEDYLQGSYRAADETLVCEHVSLNFAIGRRTGKHMLIAPDLRVQTPADHAPVGFVRFWYDRVRDALGH
jgi:hypothetical protein